MPKQEELVVSKWLKNELKKKNLTPGEFATKIAALGITRSAVYYYVSGERIPSKEIVEKLAKALNATAPVYELRRVGRPKKIQKTRTQLINQVQREMRDAQN